MLQRGAMTYVLTCGCQNFSIRTQRNSAQGRRMCRNDADVLARKLHKPDLPVAPPWKSYLFLSQTTKTERIGRRFKLCELLGRRCEAVQNHSVDQSYDNVLA